MGDLRHTRVPLTSPLVGKTTVEAELKKVDNGQSSSTAQCGGSLAKGFAFSVILGLVFWAVVAYLAFR